MTTKPRIVLGTAGFNLANIEKAAKYLEIIEHQAVLKLDTARAYGESEPVLGKLNASEKFLIDTKVPGGFPGIRQDRASIFAAQETSFKNLDVEQVDIFYLHAPDTETPFEETLSAMNDLFDAAKFRRFGISNFTPEQVKTVHSIAKQKGWVLPTVYQGSYSPVARHNETELFPILRELGISFYAYSPIAGGFLAKTVEQMKAGGVGRWDPNQRGGRMYHQLFNRPRLLEGLQKWNDLSDETKIPKSELAYRYITYHSMLSGELKDGVIVGASTAEQLDETLQGLENGPLPKEVVERIDGIWEVVKEEAPRTEDILKAVKG
ncbi:hypothetical protein HDV00_006300 [Rhizophlyctis rosea]|nr:hypothetical protein HDV00_006300 [Rhizophlyctis rosea]